MPFRFSKNGVRLVATVVALTLYSLLANGYLSRLRVLPNSSAKDEQYSDNNATKLSSASDVSHQLQGIAPTNPSKVSGAASTMSGERPSTLKASAMSKEDLLDFPWNRLLDGWKPPQWILNYIKWHSEVRSTHPAFQSSFANSTNVKLPPLYIVHCRNRQRGRECGGLHDRLGSIPFDLYFANQTKRLLLYKWDTPMALEHFLVPNRLNWSLDGLPHDHPSLKNLTEAPYLFDSKTYGSSRTLKFWNYSVPKAIQSFTDPHVPVVTAFVAAHRGEYFLEAILKSLGETDLIHTTPTFGWIWQAMFQPSPGLQRYISHMRDAMNLTKGAYTAIHIRLHFPDLIKRYYKKGNHGPLWSLADAEKNLTWQSPPNLNVSAENLEDRRANNPLAFDIAGLHLEGEGKKFAVEIGLHAIQCAQTLTASKEEPLFLCSDANNLVQYLVQRNHSHNGTSQDSLDRRADNILSQVKVVARPDIHRRNLHIDLHGGIDGMDPRNYYAAFADLYFAMEAKCVTFGYGGFGRFAQQLTNNPCFLQHQRFIARFYMGHALRMYHNVCAVGP